MSGAVGFFKNIILTNKGKELLLSSNNNIDNSIDFTICKFGDGRYTEEEIPTAIDIKSAWKTQNINTVRIDNSESDPKLIIEITFSNKDMQEPKILNELGIFARDKQGSTHLFAYSLSNVETGEEIEIENDYPTTFKISIISKISNKTNVTNIIDPDGFLTKEVIEIFNDSIRNIGFRKIKGTLNAGQKIIQVPLGAELIPISERAILNIEGEIYFLDRDYTIDTRANTITLKEPYSFNNESMYEIIDPLPPTYVKEQIQEFIDDFKQLVSDSKVDFEALRERVFLEIQQKVDDFYTQLENYIEENKENLKGHSIDRIIENGQDENGGNIYDIFRDDDRKIGTITAPKGDEGVGIDEPEYVGLTENGDTRYRWRKTDGTLTEKETIIPKGQKGNSFYIKKVYPSISDMEADFSNEEVGIGEYVIISSNDDDNGKLFEKRIDNFYFIVKMSGESYTLPAATQSELGGIIVGDGLSINERGVLSTDLSQIEYNLPIASNDILGGVKIGANMQITPDGVLNPKYPIASKSGKGIVQIGDGIDVNNGVISAKTLLEYNKPTGSILFNGESEYFNKNSLDFTENTAIGDGALCTISIEEVMSNKSLCSNNTAIGYFALNSAWGDFIGQGNTAIGSYALESPSSSKATPFAYNTAIGYNAGNNMMPFNNTTCIGYESSVTGSHQVQLGNRYTNVYCYGTVQDRSDKRDKTDIKDTSLGLEFLMKLRPREYRWDYRESYINTEEIRKISNKIKKLNKKGRKIDIKSALERFSIENIKKDGSQKGWRFHQGFIAQEVFQVMRELGVDFGGYQDHSINGGKDVLSIGYNEFIPVLVKGIQEQQKQIQEQQKQINNLLERVKILEKGGML